MDMALQVRPYTRPTHAMKPAPLTPLERLARSQINGKARRPMTELEVALNERAAGYQDGNRFLIWHWNGTTGEFTGFSVGGKLSAEK